jgi:hypothetical protein
VETHALCRGISISPDRRTLRSEFVQQTHGLKEFEPVRFACEQIADAFQS